MGDLHHPYTANDEYKASHPGPPCERAVKPEPQHPGDEIHRPACPCLARACPNEAAAGADAIGSRDDFRHAPRGHAVRFARGRPTSPVANPRPCAHRSCETPEARLAPPAELLQYQSERRVQLSTRALAHVARSSPGRCGRPFRHESRALEVAVRCRTWEHWTFSLRRPQTTRWLGNGTLRGPCGPAQTRCGVARRSHRRRFSTGPRFSRTLPRRTIFVLQARVGTDALEAGARAALPLRPERSLCRSMAAVRMIPGLARPFLRKLREVVLIPYPVRLSSANYARSHESCSRSYGSFMAALQLLLWTPRGNVGSCRKAKAASQGMPWPSRPQPT